VASKIIAIIIQPKKGNSIEEAIPEIECQKRKQVSTEPGPPTVEDMLHDHR
jgi:hypothetical protein